jgi:probable phosphoglycerate mutase
MLLRKRSRPTIVLLVRHARTASTGRKLPGKARGLHLDEEGRREAEAMAGRVAGLPVAAIYASPLERARETAAAIAARRRLAVRIEPDLGDLDVGEWTGASLKRVSRKPEWETVQRHPSGFRFPGGESFVEMQTRVTEALARIAARHAGEAVVAVSHADPIKAAVAHALGVHLDLFQRIVVSTASVTALGYGRSGPVVLALNTSGDGLGRHIGR